MNKLVLCTQKRIRTATTMAKIPRGMTANMMQIVRVNAAGRENGTSYGMQVARCDMSKFSARRKKPKKKMMICEDCGAEILSPHGHKRRFCDECEVKRHRVQSKRSHERSKRGETTRPLMLLHCSVCGADIMRSRQMRNLKCDACKQVARKRASEQYRERQRLAAV